MEGAGYALDENLRLKEIKTGKGFRFVDQSHYDQLGRGVPGAHGGELPLKREVPPWKKKDGDLDKCPVFLSKTATKAKRLLILICGSGKNMQAGLWSRTLCINDGLRSGSVLPFLEWAHARDFAVLVLNPNYHEVVRIDESSEKLPTATAHVLYAWDAICRELPAEDIALVGYSAGGHDCCDLIKHREEEVLKRLRCVAFGDTIQICINRLPDAGRMFLVHNAIDWVTSKKPLDTMVKKASPSQQKLEKGIDKLGLGSFNCKEVSAGTNRHKEVMMSAFESMCKFVLAKLYTDHIVNVAIASEHFQVDGS